MDLQPANRLFDIVCCRYSEIYGKQNRARDRISAGFVNREVFTNMLTLLAQRRDYQVVDSGSVQKYVAEMSAKESRRLMKILLKGLFLPKISHREIV